jgi:hypothetical protein
MRRVFENTDTETMDAGRADFGISRLRWSDPDRQVDSRGDPRSQSRLCAAFPQAPHKISLMFVTRAAEPKTQLRIQRTSSRVSNQVQIFAGPRRSLSGTSSRPRADCACSKRCTKRVHGEVICHIETHFVNPPSQLTHQYWTRIHVFAARTIPCRKHSYA